MVRRTMIVILLIVLVALVVVVGVIILSPYAFPEKIEITSIEGFLGVDPSIQFNITGHLHSGSANLAMNYSIIENGTRFLSEGVNQQVSTDFFGNFEFVTPQVAAADIPFRYGDAFELTVMINENGNIIAQNYNMTYL